MRVGQRKSILADSLPCAKAIGAASNGRLRKILPASADGRSGSLSLPDGSNPSAAIVQSASDVQCSRLLKTTMEVVAEVWKRSTALRGYGGGLRHGAGFPVRQADAAAAFVGFVNQWRNTGTVAKLAMRQPFVLFKGLTFQKLCLPGAFRPGDHHNKMLRPGLCVVRIPSIPLMVA